MIYILITFFLFWIIYKLCVTKEGFSGFHEVNTVIRFFHRCNDAIKSAKTGMGSFIDNVMPKTDGDICDNHYQCKDKCICEKKKCKCIPTN